jgi:hypothetical protein
MQKRGARRDLNTAEEAEEAEGVEYRKKKIPFFATSASLRDQNLKSQILWFS